MGEIRSVCDSPYAATMNRVKDTGNICNTCSYFDRGKYNGCGYCMSQNRSMGFCDPACMEWEPRSEFSYLMPKETKVNPELWTLEDGTVVVDTMKGIDRRAELGLEYESMLI